MSSNKPVDLRRSRSRSGPPVLYHVQDGLFVGRGRKGAVILEIRESQDYRSRVLYRTTFGASRWVALIAQVAVGILDAKVVEAERFHLNK